MRQEAITEREKAAELSGRNPEVLSRLAVLYHLAGRRAGVKRILRELKQQGVEGGGGDYQFAIKDETEKRELILQDLELSYRNRWGHISNLRVHQHYDPVRDDPRYAEMVRRLGLP